MLASILILAFSCILLMYWFRYTCLLVLTANGEQDYAARVAAVNHLSFLAIQDMLKTQPEESALDRLERSLEKDYRILRYLLENAADFKVRSMEQRLLLMDYRVMRLWYRAARNVSPSRACRALQEMSNIVVYFANQMGQRSAYQFSA